MNPTSRMLLAARDAPPLQKARAIGIAIDALEAEIGTAGELIKATGGSTISGQMAGLRAQIDNLQEQDRLRASATRKTQPIARKHR